jgi:hypothetical protein
MLGDKVDSDVIFEDAHVGVALNSIQQCPLDLCARKVVSMDDPAVRMPAFPSESVLSLRSPGELDAPLHKLSDNMRALANNMLDNVPMAQACPGNERILNVQIEVIDRIQHGGDAALRAVSVGVVLPPFSDDGNRAKFRRLESKREPRYPRTDNEEIGLNVHSSALPACVAWEKKYRPPCVPATFTVMYRNGEKWDKENGWRQVSEEANRGYHLRGRMSGVPFMTESAESSHSF